MGLRIVLLLSTLGLVASACMRGGVRSLEPVLPTDRLYSDNRPGLVDSLRLAVFTEAELRSRWEQATSGQPSPPSLPAIDFNRDMVLIVAAGRMSPGDQIRVDSVGVRGDFFVAVVRTVLACEPFPAEAYPVEIIRVRKTNKTVTFDERRERAPNC